MEIRSVDEKDREILGLLRENARMSYSEIGERIGLSRVAVKNRMTALENSGVIKGYSVQTDPTQFPGLIPFIAEITVSAPSFNEVSEKLMADERVVTLCEISPGCTLHAVCLAKSSENIRGFLRNFRDENPDVQRISVYNILDIRKGNVLPM